MAKPLLKDFVSEQRPELGHEAEIYRLPGTATILGTEGSEEHTTAEHPSLP